MIGVPSDSNSSFLRGSRNAPSVIRASLFRPASNTYTEAGVDIGLSEALVDAGDLELHQTSGDLQLIEAAAARHVVNRKVLALGGDHSITYPIVKAHLQRYARMNIVHFDAHPDMYPEFNGNPFSHASPFARILELPDFGKLVQVGIRASTPQQQMIAASYGVAAFGPAELEEALEALPRGAVYVSIDLDALDPAFAPGVAHPEPGGLSVRDVLTIIKAIPGNVVGADIVELNPSIDGTGSTAIVAAKFVKELAGRLWSDDAS